MEVNLCFKIDLMVGKVAERYYMILLSLGNTKPNLPLPVGSEGCLSAMYHYVIRVKHIDWRTYLGQFFHRSLLPWFYGFGKVWFVFERLYLFFVPTAQYAVIPDFYKTARQYMHTHGGGNLGMTQQILDGNDIQTILEQMGSITVAQGMDTNIFPDTGLFQG